MHRLQRVLLLSLMMVFIATGANAITVFKADLTSSQEVPPNASTATGTASFVLNDAQDKLSLNVTVFGLDFTGSQTPGNANDNLINAHIHVGPPLGQPGTNASVRWGFIGTPFNDLDGDVIVTPFAIGVGGTVVGEWDANEGNNTTLAAQLAGILAGLSYINFHTVAFPGGEIRGQIVRAPEPSAVLLLIIGLSGMGLVVRGRLAAGRKHP